MPQISFERSSLAQTSIVSLTTIAAVLLLGFILAYWTWVWFAPGVEPSAPAVADGAGAKLGQSAAGLFGNSRRNGETPAPTGINIKLHGVMAAAAGKSGYAVLQLDGKQVLAVREGQDVAPGIRLAEVRPDHVILERNGIRETLAWPKRDVSASPLHK